MPLRTPGPPAERGLRTSVPSAAAVRGPPAALLVRLPGSRGARGALGAAQGLTSCPGLSCSPPATPTYRPACKPGTTFRRSILWSRGRRCARCAREAKSPRQSRVSSRPRPQRAVPSAGQPGLTPRPVAAPGIPPGGRSGALRCRVCAGDGSAQPCSQRSAARPARGSGLKQASDPAALSACSPGLLLGREEGGDRAGEGGGENAALRGQRSRAGRRRPAAGASGGERALSPWPRILIDWN